MLRASNWFPTAEGWLYLVIVMDLFSRAILGWDLSASLAADGVHRALANAKKGPWIRPRAIFHSDRGCQYTSRLVRQGLAPPYWQQSMSAKGYCYDNAFAESCFASLKHEFLPQSGQFDSHQQAHRVIFDYLECFYNRRRRHSALGFLSPFQFIQLYFQKQKHHNN